MEGKQMNSKYSNFLTVLLVLIIIAIVAIIGFLAFKYYKTQVAKTEAEKFVESFNNQNTNNNTSILPPADGDISFEGVDEGENQNNGSTSSNNQQKYNGFLTSGTIEIPATNLKCPVLAQSEYSPKALETSVIELYGPGLNQVGNTTISGHNYRNGTFFSNNKKLNIGDKIFITDLTGKRLSYTIYDKFEAEDNYSDYMTRDTQGAIEISLSTCTDNSKARIIILAKAEV
jgi:LPXTG-site transpeptidase (sortase) family protein